LEFRVSGVFTGREEVEIAVLTDLGRDVQLEASYKGKRTLHVPRWSVRKAYSCGGKVAGIIAKLFPNDLMFLLTLDYTKMSTAAAKIYNILFVQVYDEMMGIILITCGIKDEDQEEFIDNITTIDAMELFCTIIEQEINNSQVESILKKAERLLTDRFRLGRESLDFSTLLNIVSQTSLTDSPPTSSPS
jgi:hypothetical protein